MRKQLAIADFILKYLTKIVITTSILFTITWVLVSLISMNREIKKEYDRLFEERKTLTIDQTNMAADFIRYEIKNREANLQKNLQDRVNEVIAIAKTICENNKHLSQRELKNIVKDAIKPIKYNEDRGYFFAINMDGIMQLHADHPEQEGTNMLPWKDTNGKLVFIEMIDSIKTNGDGFFEYTWTKPNAVGNNYKKITYCKYFEEFDWFFGTGEYIDDYDAAIQKDLIADIDKLRFGKDGYFFLGDWGGYVFVGQIINQNVWDYQDDRGNYLFRDIISTSQAGGGFVEYYYTRIGSKKSEKKISYVLPIPEWEWYVGAGIYISDIDEQISERKKAIIIKFAIQLLIGLLIFMSFLYFTRKILIRLSTELQHEFSIFQTFLIQYSESDFTHEFEADKLQFQEYYELCQFMNVILKEKQDNVLALRDSEEKYRELVETITDIIYTMDNEGKFTYISPQCEELMGWPPEYYINKHFADFLDQDEIKRALHNFTSHKKGSIREAVYTLRTKHGDKIWLKNSARAIYDNDKFIGQRGVLSNITKSKTAELALKESEKKFQSLFANMHDAVLIFETLADGNQNVVDLIILDINKTYLNILSIGTSLKKDDLIGRNVSDFRKNRVIYYPSIEKSERILRTEEPYTEVVTFNFITGDSFTFRATTYKTEKNRIASVLENITDQIKSENEQERLRSQLNQAQKLESIGLLAGGIAHDFNNLLTPIIGYSEIAMIDLDETTELYNNLSDIHNSALKAKDLTLQLLVFSRKQVLRPSIINYNDILDNFYNILRSSIRENIELQITKEKNLFSIEADRTQMEQILLNLALNSQDAMEFGGVLQITTENITLVDSDRENYPNLVPGNYVVLTVEDNGTGIPKEVQERMFEPFFTTKNEHGTGLGLSTVYGIVKQHGGEIKIRSEKDNGTALSVILPAITRVEASAKTIDSPIYNLYGKEKLILVEDNKVTCEMLTKMLRSFEYEVVSFTDPVKCQNYFEDNEIDSDLLITDVIMPKLNGRDLYLFLNEKKPNLRVMFISGYTDDILDKHGIDGIKFSFLQKPFSVLALARTIRSIFDSE